MEFMERYEELAVRSNQQLSLPVHGVDLYPEYYKKALGKLCGDLYHKLSRDWVTQYDPEMKYIKKEFIVSYNDMFMIYPKKTRGVRFFFYVLLPFALVIVLPLLYCILWRCILRKCFCKEKLKT